jgi:hypothetical protein
MRTIDGSQTRKCEDQETCTRTITRIISCDYNGKKEGKEKKEKGSLPFLETLSIG